MRTKPHISKILIATITVLLLAQVMVLAETQRRSGGPVTSVNSATASDDVATSSNFVVVPGMTATVAAPRGDVALLVITFTAESNCVSSSANTRADCFVRVYVNDQMAGEVVFDNSRDGKAWSTKTMQFVTGPLGPGHHTVKVKYAVGNDITPSNRGWFHLRERTLTVLRSRT